MGVGHAVRVWLSIVTSVVAVGAGCNGSAETAETTTPQTVVSTTTTATATTAIAPAATTPPGNNVATTVAPTLAPRSKADVAAEAIAVINGLNTKISDCLEDPQRCDLRADLGQYGSLSTPVVIDTASGIRKNRGRQRYALDGDAHVRAVESITVADDLNSVEVVTCEIDPVVIVEDVAGEQRIVNDAVGRNRETYGLVRLVDGRLLIGPSNVTSDLNPAEMPACEDLYANGTPSPLLATDNNTTPIATTPAPTATTVIPPTVPVTTNPAQINKLETDLRDRTIKLRADIDACIDQVDTCDIETITDLYPLGPNTTAGYYPSLARDFIEQNQRYENIANNTSNFGAATANNDGTIITITECYHDKDQLLNIATNPPEPIDAPPQLTIFTYQWANLASHGWTLLSADRHAINPNNPPPPCKK